MKRIPFLLTLLIFTAILSGCASSGGSHQLVSAANNSGQLVKYTDLQLNIQPVTGVKLDQSDTERMTKLIVESIQTGAPNRFKTINSTTPGTSTLQATVKVKNYDEGNAFARFMFAGLGQIHIDADVVLSDAINNTPLEQHQVNKTFAWGGVYGVSTNIKDAEVGFCKAVADTILGKE